MAFDPARESIHGEAGQHLLRLSDGGQIDAGEAGHHHIVESDDREFAGHRDRQPVGAVEQVDGTQVVRGDEGGRPARSRQDLLDRRLAQQPILRPLPMEDGGGQAGAFHRLAISCLACPIGGVLDDRVGAIGDPFMAEPEQMLGGVPGAALVVGADDVAPLGRAGDEDGGHLALEQGPGTGRAAGIGEKYDSGDPLLEQAFEASDLDRLLALGVAEHDTIAARRGETLDLLCHLGIEGVGEIADHDAEDRRSLMDHLARQDVGTIGEFLDRPGDLELGFRRDAPNAADHVRDGGLRHACAFGDIENRRRLGGRKLALHQTLPFIDRILRARLSGNDAGTLGDGRPNPAHASNLVFAALPMATARKRAACRTPISGATKGSSCSIAMVFTRPAAARSISSSRHQGRS